MSLERIQTVVAGLKIGLGVALAAGLVWRSQSYREPIGGYELLAPTMLTVAAVVLVMTTIAVVLGRSEQSELEQDA